MDKLMREVTGEEYNSDFSFENTALNPVSRGQNALKTALDVRKFEIELYWKRATYFWAFLAVIFGAYFTVFLAKNEVRQLQEWDEALLLLACLGTVFAVAWYFVNRASKFWQENWEKHVDLLEDANQGPLYKTVINLEKRDFWQPTAPYPFSVSKLNQILSLFIAVLFIALLNNTLVRYFGSWWPTDGFARVVLVITALAILALWLGGQTSKKNSMVSVWRRTTAVGFQAASTAAQSTSKNDTKSAMQTTEQKGAGQ